MRGLFGLAEYREPDRRPAGGDGRLFRSAKDGGRLAANWALYTAQEQLVGRPPSAGFQLTLFHGRGGSVSRGGGPTYLAIQSQPPGSIDGRLRVTEQGEMIQAQFGLPDIALRTLELYTTATLEATLAPSPPPPDRWRHAMDSLAAAARGSLPRRRCTTSRASCRTSARRRRRWSSAPCRSGAGPPAARHPVAWRRCAPSPGSSPGRRRACSCPPGWAPARRSHGRSPAVERRPPQELYREWPFFRSTIDLVAMVLAKTDSRIAAEYDRQLVPPELAPLGRDLRDRLERTIAAVLEVTGRKELLADNAVLRRSIAVRNPYVDPINLVQIELLRRLRRDGDQASHEVWTAVHDHRQRHRRRDAEHGVASAVRYAVSDHCDGRRFFNPGSRRTAASATCSGGGVRARRRRGRRPSRSRNGRRPRATRPPITSPRP